MHTLPVRSRNFVLMIAVGLTGALTGCGGGHGGDAGGAGPTTPEVPVVHQVGSATSGRNVFRFETFGNERYWTDRPCAAHAQLRSACRAGYQLACVFPAATVVAAGQRRQITGPRADRLTKNSTEAEVDAYLNNPAFYPIGTFDDTFDGNGDPMHNAVLFRTDLGAPWGTDGTIARLDDFSNLVYTGLLDPTGITTLGGAGVRAQAGWNGHGR